MTNDFCYKLLTIWCYFLTMFFLGLVIGFVIFFNQNNKKMIDNRVDIILLKMDVDKLKERP